MPIEASIIVPMRNNESHVAACVGSITAGGDNIELIIANDGSEDMTLEKILALATKDIRIVVVDQPRLGITRTLNRLTMLSRADIIIRLDGRDKNRNDRVSRITRWFASDPELALLTSNYWVVSKKQERMTLRSVPSPSLLSLLKHNPYAHSALAFRKSHVGRAPYDERFRFAQDYELYLRVLYQDLKFGVIPDALVEHNISDRSTTSVMRLEQFAYDFAAKTLYSGGERMVAREVRSAALRLLILSTVPRKALSIARNIRSFMATK